MRRANGYLNAFELACFEVIHMQANAVFATGLARRYGEQGIVATSVNPGISPHTRINIYSFPPIIQETSEQT
jgi:NAD(P)-dependent dehydrogenase (short-subunit alcohol dehydrogenase family)